MEAKRVDRLRRSLSSCVLLVVATTTHLAFAQSTANVPPAFVAPALRRPHGAWSDGADRLYVAAGMEGLVEIVRGVSSRRVPDVGPVLAVDGVGTGDALDLVAIGFTQIARMQHGRMISVPRPLGTARSDRLVDVAVVADGTAYIPSRYGGLHVWRGTTPVYRTVAYPREIDAAHIVATPGGRVFVSGLQDALLEFANGRLVDAPFLAAVHAAAPTCHGFDALWLAPSTEHLWVGCSDGHVLEVDLASGAAQLHETGLAGSVLDLVGARVDGVDQIVAVASDGIVAIEGELYHPLESDGTAVDATAIDGLCADPRRATLYTAGLHGLRAIALTRFESVDADAANATDASVVLDAITVTAAPARRPRH